MKLRVVPTKAHAAVDHVVGPTLVFAPELFGLKNGKKDALPTRATGTAQSIYSNLTDYELSVKRLLPMKAHLAMDAAAGAVLGAMPWMLGTRKRGLRHWVPQAVVGGMEIGLALTTKTEPRDRHRPDERLRYAWKAAKHPATWSAIGKTGMTVATWSPLRKASRKLARLAA